MLLPLKLNLLVFVVQQSWVIDRWMGGLLISKRKNKIPELNDCESAGVCENFVLF